jgi:hypothetical protein
MKPFVLGSQDYYTASLRQLEETRGHLFTEEEYRALRKETLDELATVGRRSIAGVATVGTVLLACVVGGVALVAGVSGPLFMWLASAGVFACGAIGVGLRAWRQRESVFTLHERLQMLHSLREHRLVTFEEFRELQHRLELPLAA